MTNDGNKIIDHEGRIAKLEEAVHQVCMNHIPHIQEDIKNIKTLLTRLLIGVILAAAGVILDLLIRR